MKPFKGDFTIQENAISGFSEPITPQQITGPGSSRACDLLISEPILSSLKLIAPERSYANGFVGFSGLSATCLALIRFPLL
jgi:hypothetical protein